MGSFQFILRRKGILSPLNCMLFWNEDQSEFGPLALRMLSYLLFYCCLNAQGDNLEEKVSNWLTVSEGWSP